MKRSSFLLVSMILLAFSASSQDSTYKAVEFPEGFRSQIDVVYAKVNGWDGRMDLYTSTGSKPTPIVINIHGGGWNKGVKESQTGYNSFFKAGIAVANIEYRLSGQANAPAAVQDTRCALIYLISHAKELNIDVKRIIIMGSSAGGHLALMGGLLGNDHRFDNNCPGAGDVKVAAIIDKYGITDVNDWAYGPYITSKSATQWLGDKAKDAEFIRSVSPITYVTKNSPPVFIVHGDADPTVPYQESVMLQKKLEEHGVKHKFITIPGGLHGKFTKEQNSDLNKSIIDFLKECKII